MAVAVSGVHTLAVQVVVPSLLDTFSAGDVHDKECPIRLKPKSSSISEAVKNRYDSRFSIPL